MKNIFIFQYTLKRWNKTHGYKGFSFQSQVIIPHITVEWQMKILILLFSLFSQGIALAQKLVTYNVNERDTSLYRSAEYEFKELSISSTRLDLYTIIEKLSVEHSSEMYVVRFSHRHNRVFITIQNWEYRGINSITESSIYGMFRFKGDKDFLVCYDGTKELSYIKKYFSINKEKINISIRIESVPNNIYILPNDLITYYKGVIVHNKLKTIKLIVNNKLMFNIQ